MPLSDDRHRPQLIDWLGADRARIRSVVDVGAGFGGWHAFLRPWLPDAHWTAVEIWQPYIDRFLFAYRYNTVLCADIRAIDPPPADLYIFGDVLEHMGADEACSVWAKARQVSARLVLGIPVVCYPQGEAEGNPYETHVATWDTAMVLRMLPGITAHAVNDVTGLFYAEGERPLP